MNLLFRFMKGCVAIFCMFAVVSATLLSFAALVQLFSGSQSNQFRPGAAVRLGPQLQLKARALADTPTLYRALVVELRTQAVLANVPPLGYGGMLQLRAGLDKITESLSKCRKFRSLENDSDQVPQRKRVKFFAVELHPSEPRLLVTSIGQDQDSSLFSVSETICLRDSLETARQPEWLTLQRPPQGSYQILVAIVSARSEQDEP